jgi:hypothetical protein
MCILGWISMIYKKNMILYVSNFPSKKSYIFINFFSQKLFNTYKSTPFFLTIVITLTLSSYLVSNGFTICIWFRFAWILLKWDYICNWIMKIEYRMGIMKDRRKHIKWERKIHPECSIKPWWMVFCNITFRCCET